MKSNLVQHCVSSLSLLLLLSACTTVEKTLEGDQVDYGSGTLTRAQVLEVPPDLSQLKKKSEFDQLVLDGKTKLTPVLSAFAQVKVMREGTLRWLRVDAAATELWPKLEQFWLDNGFILEKNEPGIGIMQTKFALRRPSPTLTGVRAGLAQVFGGDAYSTSLQDQYRTRLDPIDEKTTDIFITHKGLLEQYTATRQENTVWQPRPTDPELEAEFMNRLMVTLGSTREEAKHSIDTNQPKASIAQIINEADGQTELVIDAAMDSAWKAVLVATDRAGFELIDRDIARRWIFVAETKLGFQSQSLVSKLFSNDDVNHYQFRLNQQEGRTHMVVMTDEGKAVDATKAKELFRRLIDFGKL